MLNFTNSVDGMPVDRTFGFTLVELLITMSIVGILMALAVPAFSSWIAGVEVRNAAETIQNGLRMAQAEAVHRNAEVDFIMTAASPPDATATANGVTPNTTGPNWIVQQHIPSGTTATSNYFIHGYLGTEGSKNVSYTVTNSTNAVTSFTGLVTFNGYGRLITGAQQASDSPTSPTSAFYITAASSRQPSAKQLEVQVSVGGRIRMCIVGLPAADPEAC